MFSWPQESRRDGSRIKCGYILVFFDYGNRLKLKPRAFELSWDDQHRASGRNWGTVSGLAVFLVIWSLRKLAHWSLVRFRILQDCYNGGEYPYLIDVGGIGLEETGLNFQAALVRAIAWQRSYVNWREISSLCSWNHPAGISMLRMGHWLETSSSFAE